MEWNLLFLGLIYFLLKLEGNTFIDIGLNQQHLNIKTVVLSFIIALTFSVFSMFILYPLISYWIVVPVNTSAFDDLHQNFPKTGLTLLRSWLFAAFAEEIIFRGYIIYQIRAIFYKQSFKNVAAILFSSVAFAFIHAYQGIGGVVYTGVGGLFFALLYLRFRNLYLNICIHGFLNTFFILKKYWGVDSWL